MNRLVDKIAITELLSISKGKLDSMIKNNQIPYIRMGKVIRFDMEDVLNSLKS